MEELTEFNQMNGYRDIQMIKVKAKYKVLRATGSVVESFTEVRLRGEAGFTCGTEESNVEIKRFLPGIQLVRQ